MFRLAFIIAVPAVLGLSACGQTDMERTATGAVIGGAAGQVVSGDPLTGALIGGAAGATCRSLGTCPNN